MPIPVDLTGTPAPVVATETVGSSSLLSARTAYPRAVVTFAGQSVRWDDIRSLEWEPNVTYQADSLIVVLDNVDLKSNFLRKEQPVDLSIGYVVDPDSWTSAELTPVFSGKVDEISCHFADDRTVTVKARDYSRVLLDSTIGDSEAQEDFASNLDAKTWANMTVSALVTDICTQLGLTANVVESTASSTNEDESITYIGKSAWDTIQTLAVRVGYVAYVDLAHVLHFRPRADENASIGTFAYLAEPYDVLTFDPTDSGLIVNKVIVSRWTGIDEGFLMGFAKDDARITAMDGRIVAKTIPSTTATSDEECTTQAEALLKAFTRPAMTAAAAMEGNPALIGDVKLTLGPDTTLGRFASDWYIEKATHRFGLDGYTCQLALTNTRPEASEVYKDALYATTETAEDRQAAIDGLALYSSGGGVVVKEALVTPSTAWTNTGTHFVQGRSDAGAADIFALIGASIYAPVSGTIVLADVNDALGGNNAVLQGSDGQWYYFAHGNIPFQKGPVTAGQQIGQVGQTGRGGGPPNQAIGSTGASGWSPHCHFAVSKTNNFNALAGKGDVHFGSEYWWIQGKAPPSSAVVGGGAARGSFDAAPADLQTAIKKYFPSTEWNNAAAIAKAESGWIRTSTNESYYRGGGDLSYGYFQINIQPSANPSLGPKERLFETDYNTSCAFRLWSGRGGSWSAWSTAPGLGLS